jgi:hypothetical protein
VAYLLGAIGGLLECWFFLRLRVPSEDVALAEDAASGPVAQTPHAQEASGSETSLPFQASPDLHTSPETADFQASSARQASPEASTSGDLSSNSVSTLSEQPGLESAAAIPAPSPAPSPTPLPKRRLLSRIVNSLKFKAGPEYYLFCIAAVIFTFAWMAAWPVFTKLKVDVLQATNMQISIDTVGSAIGSLIGFRYWARLIEKKGNAGTLFMATMAVAANPLMWLFANSMTAVYFIDMFGACATAGYTLALFNRQLEIVPAASRQKSIAFYTTLSQISAVIAPIVGMKLFESIDFAGTMWISTLVRIFGSLCFLIILQPFVGNWLNKRAKQS